MKEAERTPITAEKWFNTNLKRLLCIKGTKGQIQYPFKSHHAQEEVEQYFFLLMEQYAKHKVLEALEMVRNTNKLVNNEWVISVDTVENIITQFKEQK